MMLVSGFMMWAYWAKAKRPFVRAVCRERETSHKIELAPRKGLKPCHHPAWDPP